MKTIASFILAGLVSLLIAGCLTAPVPMRTEAFLTSGPKQEKDLFVFFPGRRGTVDDFERYGYVEVLHEQLPTADSISVDARMGYYRNRTIVERVKTDALDAVDYNKYRRVYLVGTSMGGMGALLTANEYPEQVSGILLIAPFIGYDEILDEITAAGGLNKWEPSTIGKRDWQREIWELIKQGVEGRSKLPPITLAYGRDDYLGQAHRLLAEALPPEQVIVMPGEHINADFIKLWSRLLATVEGNE